jgi:hypothetical protein
VFALSACAFDSSPGLGGKPATEARDHDDRGDPGILDLGRRPYKDDATGTLELDGDAGGSAGGGAGMGAPAEANDPARDASVPSAPAVDASVPADDLESGACPLTDPADCDTLLATVTIEPVTDSLISAQLPPFAPQGRFGTEGTPVWLESMIVHGSTFEQSFLPSDAKVAGVARALEGDVWTPVADICAGKCAESTPADPIDLRGKHVTRFVFALDTYSETPNGDLLDQTFGGRWEVRGS